MNDSSQITNSENITTAVLLAAGTGTRLQPLTLDAPKCLTEVGGIPILQRLIDNLREQGFKRLVIVTGHLRNCIEEYLELHAADLQIDFRRVDREQAGQLREGDRLDGSGLALHGCALLPRGPAHHTDATARSASRRTSPIPAVAPG